MRFTTPHNHEQLACKSPALASLYILRLKSLAQRLIPTIPFVSFVVGTILGTPADSAALIRALSGVVFGRAVHTSAGRRSLEACEMRPRVMLLTCEARR